MRQGHFFTIKRGIYIVLNKSSTDIMVPYLVEYYYVNTQYGNIYAHMYSSRN